MTETKPRRQVAKLLTEFVVIVAGVLVALTAESWWSDRQDQERVEGYLEQLLTDLDATEEHLRGLVTSRENTVTSGSRLLDALSQPTLPPGDTLDSLVGRLARLEIFRPTLGTVDALVETGDLRLIGDSEVKRLLLRYRNGARSGLEVAQIATGITLAGIERLGQSISFTSPVEDGRLPENDWESLSRDRRIHNEVGFIVGAVDSQLNEIRQFQSVVAELTAALRAY